MKHSARLAAAAALAVIGSVTLACQNGVTGPTLSATVRNLALQPTVSGLDGGANVCCCRVTGQVTNTSSVTAHIELLFAAKSTAGQLIGTAADMQRDVTPGGTRSFQATGIPMACRDVNLAQIAADQHVRLIGLWEPQ